MMRMLVRLLINAASIFLAAALLDGLEVRDFKTALVAAVVFGLFNTFLRPVLKLLALPINLITLGLFTLVINGLMLTLTAHYVEGLQVQGLLTGIIGAIVISVIGWVLGLFFDRDDD